MRKLSIVIVYSLFSTGMLILFLSIVGKDNWNWNEITVSFIRDVGLLLSATMAGSIIHEVFLRDDHLREIEKKLHEEIEEYVPTTKMISERTAQEVHLLFQLNPPSVRGLFLAARERRGFSDYYKWIIENGYQELHFAGRSVLHRIDAEVRGRTGSSAADEIFRKLTQGARIKIDFLDPRTEMLERLAKDEGQRPEKMMFDIRRSIEVCKELAEILKKSANTLPYSANIEIRIYDRVPNFAYHRQNDEAIVGFYFLSSKGYESAAYRIIDQITQSHFVEHFEKIHSDAADSRIIEYSGSHDYLEINDHLIDEIIDYIKMKTA